MSAVQLSCRSVPLAPQMAAVAANVLTPAQRTANSLYKIIQFLFYRVPVKNRAKYVSRVRGKIIRMVPTDIGIKKMPPTSVIGQSVAITKNILNGLHPSFVNEVIMELSRLLAGAPQVPMLPVGGKET